MFPIMKNVACNSAVKQDVFYYEYKFYNLWVLIK